MLVLTLGAAYAALFFDRGDAKRSLRAYVTVLKATLRETVYVEPGWEVIITVKNTGSTASLSRLVLYRICLQRPHRART